MKRKYRRGGLGAPDSDHLQIGVNHIHHAWNDLERMPGTCEGGIQVASRALASAERGLAHLHAIEDRGMREAESKTFGLGNRATFAAGRTLDFFSRVCKAPGGEARAAMFNRREPTKTRRR